MTQEHTDLYSMAIMCDFSVCYLLPAELYTQMIESASVGCTARREVMPHVDGLMSGLLEHSIRALFRLIGSLLGGHFP